MSGAPPVYDWEDVGIDSGESGDSSSDDDDTPPTPEECGDILIDFLLELLWTNRLSAKSVCTICYWASRAGATSVARFSMRPSAPSGHFQRKVDRATGVSLKKEKERLFNMRVPLHTKYDSSRKTRSVLARLPHEELAQEVEQNPLLLVEGDEYTEALAAHPVALANPGVPILPYALYLDGIPFLKKDGMLAVFVYCLRSMTRHLCMVLRRTEFCKCGCKGWCSLYVLFETLAWSFSCLAKGQWPSARPSGEAIPPESARGKKGGSPLGFVGALLEIRGDWSEFTHTLGLRDWSSKYFCCLYCDADRSSRFDLEGFNVRTSPWKTLEYSDFDAASSNSEHWRTLTAEQHAEVRAALKYLNQKPGGGRVLQEDLPHLDLLRGDRLEPHPGLPDVALFDVVDSYPCRTLFWRAAADTRTRHRNPMWDPTIGVTTDRLMVDTLHTIYLGVCQVWIVFCLNKLINADVYQTRSAGEQLRHLTVLRMKSELWAWYKDRRRARPDREITQVQDFTVAMLGGTDGHGTLHAKAAETKGLVPFALSLVAKFEGRLVPLDFRLMRGSGAALQEYIQLLDSSPRVVPRPTIQKMYDAAKRHIVLCRQMGVRLRPKHHLFLHLVARTSTCGNPNSYSTFEDESINRVLKNVGEGANLKVWHTRILLNFKELEKKRQGQKRHRQA